jgi:PAS domain S-box-containing protein
MLPGVLGPNPFIAFYLAWVGAAAFGGLGPCLLATAASWVCVETLFNFTPGQTVFNNAMELARFLTLMAGGLTVGLVAERMRRARLHERRQRRQLEDLGQLTGLGHFLIRDDRDRITFWSDGCARLYGFTAEQAVGRVSHELLRTEFPQPADSIRARLRETGRWEGELAHRRADGSPVHVASLWVLREDADHPVVLEVNNDITDRKRTEESLRQSEEQFHRLFEDDLTGDYISTPQGRILLCNPAFAAMFGFSSVQDAVGTSILSLYIDPGERGPLVEKLRKEGKSERLEVWRRRLDGTRIHIVENLVGHFDDRGELYQIQGYLFEDTQRQWAEEALQRFNEELEQRVQQRTAELLHRTRQLQKLTLELSQTEDRERKRMAEILHDDLQQLLAAAKFHLELMRNRARHDPSVLATATQIDHMLMEAIQKSRSLSHELSPAVMHHADFVETLRWLANQVQAKHGLVVHVHAHGEVRSQSDALRGFLYKTVQELLFNIVKHARVDEASVGVRPYGHCICLTVSDRGRGFDPQSLRDAAGFGLMNIRERVELLGGRMKIRSAVGKGSTFFVVVPRETAQSHLD